MLKLLAIEIHGFCRVSFPSLAVEEVKGDSARRYIKHTKMGTLFMIICISAVGFSQALYCHTSLPQDVAKHSPCHFIRNVSLIKQQSTYGIKPPSLTNPFARLDMGIKDFSAFVLRNPFLRQQASRWLLLAGSLELLSKQYVKKTSGLPSIMKEYEFWLVEEYFRTAANKLLDGFVERPSRVEPFNFLVKTWISDELFAEQRLAGVNPMTLTRVTSSDEIGVNWNHLTLNLNKDFDWENAVSKALGGTSLDKAIEEGYLYVLHHPLSDDIKTAAKDKGDDDPQRKMWKYMSPIAFFVSVPAKHWWSKAKLLPLAIQMDHTPDSPVYTTGDGDLWTIAKLNVQLTDLECSQIVEHLSKVHLVSEGLCVSIERQLSKHHPLYDIMRYHCRGVFVANTFGAPTLLYPGQKLDYLFPYGWKEANKLVIEISKKYEWSDLQLQNNLKRRGVDNYRLISYYPYRDDGLEVEKVIRFMVTDYVDAYYRTDMEVQKDVELQNYANEVSDKGIQPGGAQVQIRGFPPSIDSKEQLVDTFTQMIWLMSGQHSAVNYPMADYTSYVPNMPCKLYDSERVPNTTLSPERLPNRNETAAQISFAMALSSFRLDRLFDYAEYLQDPKGRKIVLRYFYRLNAEVEPMLERRNKARLAQGHLTYPYMQPRWLPNGIET